MLILVIVIIILAALLWKKTLDYKDKEYENEMLKKKIKAMQSSGVSFSNMPLDENKDTAKIKIEKEIIKDETKESKKEKTKITEKEKKDIGILVTGAICIVLAAVVFLLSTWNVIPDVLKTLVLALVTAVFFGGSYIAKKKYSLDKVSQTFYYIAMAYIPICLLSISVFELFGEYLGIYGEGKYMYFAVASIFVAVVYYLTYLNKESRYLLYGSVLTQIFAVISFSLILSDDVILIGVNLLLYNILLMQLTKKGIFAKVYNFIPAVITIDGIWGCFTNSGLASFMLFLLAVNYLMLEVKKSRRVYGYMFHASFVVFGVHTIMLYTDTLGSSLSDVFILLFVLAIYILELITLRKNKEKRVFLNTSAVVTVCALAFLHIQLFLEEYMLKTGGAVKPYMVSVCQTIILAIIYSGAGKKGKIISGILMPGYFAIAGIDVIIQLQGTDTAYVLLAIIIFAISELFRKKDVIPYNVSKIISFVVIYLTAFEQHEASIIIAMIFAAIMIAQSVKEKSREKSILPLVCIIPAVFLNRLDMNLRLALMSVLTLAVTLISVMEKEVSIYTIASFIYMCFTIDNIHNEYIKEIILVIWAIAHYIYMTEGKQKDVFKFITGLSILFLYNTLVEDMGLDSYTIFIMLGWITLAIYTTREILRKYMNTDNIEYFVLAIMYLGALCNYVDEIDGMIFVLLIIGVMMLSYTKKYGAIFMVSMYAILINVIALTREFWFSVPWWLYLLAIGAVLIGFGTRNEIDEKKPGAIDRLKNIKNNIEK